MSNQKARLELTWIGKEKRPRLEPRILLEEPDKSYHARHRVTDNDIFDNKLIFGDNLLALKALEQEYAGKVKCVFIDPPYNTGSAFKQYDDGLEHSIWLGLMRDRLEILYSLLSESGSLWITIDDNEAHYLKILCDEIFGGKQFAKTGKSPNLYPIITPSGREVWPAKGRAWAYVEDSYKALLEDKKVHFGKNGDSKPTIKRFLSEIEDKGVVPMTSWHYKDVGENRTAAQEVKSFNPDDPFTTPKPEALLHRVITLATKKGDLVLDSFAGSGTTGAVAQKMGRRWIMVELGEHCHTHIIPRLQKVIDGEDKGGISKAVNWQGGGGFRYFKVAPSLLEQDAWGRWVVNKEYHPEMLAEAICKLEGFIYKPSDSVFWQQGYSTESDFIYVTTQNLSQAQLQVLSDEVGQDRTLLVCCGAFRCKADKFANLTLKKIPKMVLSRCEWGHDDYSLNVENLPMQEKESLIDQGDLFDDGKG